MGALADAQRSLQTTQRRFRDEAGRRLAQLVGVRFVLCVIDGQQVPGRLGECEVERARLGAGMAGRRDEHLQPRRARRGLDRSQGGGVVRLQHQEALQPVTGVVDAGQIADQLRRDRRLVVQGRQYGVARPFVRAGRERDRREAEAYEGPAPDGGHNEGALKRDDDRQQGGRGGVQAAQHKRARAQDDGDRLPRRGAQPRRARLLFPPRRHRAAPRAILDWYSLQSE